MKETRQHVGHRTSDEVAELRARVEKLEAALRFYEDEANWRMNRALDPNGPNFIGCIHARAALWKETGE